MFLPAGSTGSSKIGDPTRAEKPFGCQFIETVVEDGSVTDVYHGEKSLIALTRSVRRTGK
jgi:hypothetical protein